MRLDLYQVETARIVAEQSALLDEVRERLLADKPLSPLEQRGVLHILQVLAENAIGKAKLLLKAEGLPVPVSAYDAFSDLSRHGAISTEDLSGWNSIIGMRNRIVHDYMNIDMGLILDLIRLERYRFLVDFLQKPIRDA